MDVTVQELQKAVGDRYRVERELGAGGMATVYVAQDPRHDRRVAIKVLRPELAAIVGGERFLKEIRTTANLQHPHILPLHDSGSAEGLVYYVMPYVEGESLRRRLVREKQLPIEEAVRIAAEVASGLDYAHRRGVLHRDIKPENILLHDGRAIIADFGIALAFSRSDGSTRMTETGMSLGTPNYMSPEQAMGERDITPRSDVYALGCVLYEMLAGEPPFTGPTPQAVIARVLTDEPRSLVAQRRTIPAHVAAATLRALEKIPADRFGTASLFAEALAGPLTSRESAIHAALRPERRRMALWKLAAAGGFALLLVAAATGLKWLATPSTLPQPARFSIRVPDDHRLSGAFFGGMALSPDGGALVYVGENAGGSQLFLRRLDDLRATPLAGTDGGANPVFIPDGNAVAFSALTGFKNVSLNGGTPVPIDFPRGAFVAEPMKRGAWALALERGDLAEWSSGSVLRIFARPDTSVGETGLIPMDVLPDGRVLTLAMTRGLTGSVLLFDPRSGKRRTVMKTPVAAAKYQDGVIAWVLPRGALLAADWNERRGELGPPQVIATDVRVVPGGAPQIAFSNVGSLVYVPLLQSNLVVVNRAGRVELESPSRRFHSPSVSPDGTRIAADITGEARDVWVFNRRDTTLTRVTFDNDGHDPMWLADGRTMLYARARSNTIGIHRTRADGSAPADSVLHQGAQLTAHAAARNGSFAIAALVEGNGNFDLLQVGLTARRITARPMLASPFNETHPALSPNDKWLAYVSDESGRTEVYLRAVNDPAGRITVSQAGGTEPVWSRDGRELFYRDLTGPSLIAARIETQPELRVASRTTLFRVADFETSGPHAAYDVTPDGKFVFIRTARATELLYVQNWPTLVRRRAAER